MPRPARRIEVGGITGSSRLPCAVNNVVGPARLISKQLQPAGGEDRVYLMFVDRILSEGYGMLVID